MDAEILLWTGGILFALWLSGFRTTKQITGWDVENEKPIYDYVIEWRGDTGHVPD